MAPVVGGAGRQALAEVRLSTLADNFFCLHVPTEHDYLLVSPRKTEIVDALSRVSAAALGQPLPVKLDNSFSYKAHDGTLRQVVFAETPGAGSDAPAAPAPPADGAALRGLHGTDVSVSVPMAPF